MRRILHGAHEVLDPEMFEDMAVPSVLIKGTLVNDFQPPRGVDAEFIRAQPDNRSMSLVKGMYRANLCTRSSFPPYPYRQDGRGEMSIGYFGQRREIGGVDDVSDKKLEKDKDDSYHSHRKHSAWRDKGSNSVRVDLHATRHIQHGRSKTPLHCKRREGSNIIIEKEGVEVSWR